MCRTLSRAGGGARSAWPSDGAHSGAETGEPCAAAIPTVIVTLMAPPPRRLCLHLTLPEAPPSQRGRCPAYPCCHRCLAAAVRRRHLWAVRGIVGSYLHNIRVAERHEALWFSDVMPHDFGKFLVPHNAWPRAATAPAPALDAAPADPDPDPAPAPLCHCCRFWHAIFLTPDLCVTRRRPPWCCEPDDFETW